MKGRIPLALLVAAPLAVFAQQPGQRISIATQKREVVDGRFVRWSDNAIEIARGKKTQSFALSDVKRVQAEQKASRWKSAMWGAIAGFVVVFPCAAAKAGYITDQNNPSAQTRIGVGSFVGLFGAGIGAGVGALAGGHKYVTVYDEKGGRR